MTLDVYALPSTTFGEVQTFTGITLDSTRTSTTNAQWRMWQKPRGATVVQILAIGGGGGGGCGYPFPAGNQRQGGGGGGSGAQSMVILPAMLLPDVLYVQTGLGGGGGVNAVRGGDNGGITYVAIAPDTTVDNVVCYAAYGFGGANGAGGSGSAANGAGGTAATISLMPLGGAGVYSLLSGQAGGIGGDGLGGAGGSITPPTNGTRAMGGAGGGGCWTQTAGVPGGGFTVAANTYLAGQAPVTAAAGVNGVTSLATFSPLTLWGGGGGGASYNAAGGRGGNGAYGGGGGGSGAGTSGTVPGGSGGGGLVLISTW
jgi:hypothetical protein